MSHEVRTWREQIVIPTYGVGLPNPNPMFLNNRIYQGSSGKVYPLPVIDRVDDEKHDQNYDAIFIENEFLKIMILPELGGRVQMALDKTNGYHFIYYNRVIKPALVGLVGPWISGGIEFNWPQHHRPTTFMPLASEIIENDDGSQTVWCSEIDRMYGTKGAHGFTLYPGKAYLEVKVRLFNRTDQKQTYLWWANPAAHVDENHQTIFPPDVRAVMDHGRRDVSDFPIATGTYYKVDYSPGTDISRYRNIPVPTSYMANRSDYDFVASYDHRQRAGLLHVANHHIAPGKKQWTWGHGDFGRAWDRQLTDEDGPYIELMCGVFTDNQPDFSWLAPGEERLFSQYFMPYKGVGAIKNATKDAAIGLDFEDGKATLRVYLTSDQLGCRAVVTRGTQIHLDESFDGSPQAWYERSFETCNGDVLDGATIVVSDRFGNVLVSWCIGAAPEFESPDPARSIDAPDRLDSVESLYLAGLHLEQYRHATREPEDYYREGLWRDPGDIRCNNALGALLYRRGLFAEAEACFRRAIERLTRHNPNPHDGEAHYNLGLSLFMQDRYDEAVSVFYKATWNAAIQDAAYFQLARLAVRQANYLDAENLLQRCLDRNAGHSQAAHLLVVVLMKLGRLQEALSCAECALNRDPFNYGILFETSLDSGCFSTLDARARHDWNNYLETAIDYASAGLLDAAIAVLKHYLEIRNHRSESALVYYYLADYCEQQGNSAEASEWYLLAQEADSSYCFPNKLSDIGVLQRAASMNSNDARALYYLGNLWYDRARPVRAIACWEQSRERDTNNPTVWRNLGLAYYNNRKEPELAWDAFTRAIQLRPTDARVFYELDQLARRLNHSLKDRFKRLDAHRSLVQERDDLYLEYVTLLNLLGRHQDALNLLLARTFHPWEGGEGKVAMQFVVATTELAREALQEHRFDDALLLLEQAQHWPKSLGEGKLPGIKENNTFFYLGLAHHGQGQSESSRQFLELAADGNVEPTSAKYYNDHPPEMAYYQGLALRALHREKEARMRFQSLIDFGTAHLSDDVAIDFFAVSLPDFLVINDDLHQRHEIHCRFMMALGYLGLSDVGRAMTEFEAVLSQDQSHQGAVTHRRQLDLLREFGLMSISRDSSGRAVVSGPLSAR